MKAHASPLAFAMGLAFLVSLTIGVSAGDSRSRGAAWIAPPAPSAGQAYKPLISFTTVATTTR